ncbi:hypothetical protein ACWDZX_17740, partial [Streptomyces collinus]
HSSRAREEWCAGMPQETAARAVPGPPDAPEPLTPRVAGVAGEAGPCGRGLAADHPAGRP